MKQLALVLLIAATSLSVSAQKDYRDNNRNNDRVDRYDDKYDRNNGRDDRNANYDRNGRNNYDRFDRRQKEELRIRLERINHDYDAKIHSIRRNPFLGSGAKSRKINELEYDRNRSLNECRARFYRQMDYTQRDRNNRGNKW